MTQKGSCRTIPRALTVLAVLLLALAPRLGNAEQRIIERAHAIAMHGEPKYKPGFSHFDYVNPDAPKGGSLNLAATGTFDSFNPYIPKGNAASAGSATETLLTSSDDEPFTEYGLLAESMTYPEDRSWITFHLRPEARWHDGKPVTPEDVVFSLNTLKEMGQPFYRFYYGSVASAEVTGEYDVTFRFAGGENREMPLIVGQLPVLPKHYWEERDFAKTTLEPPLGSGPYRVVDFEPGRHLVVERVKDYWGKDLAVNKGQNNFDRIRYDYYRDPTVIREAVKAGDVDYHRENQAKAWAQDYNVAAVREGWLIKEAVPHERPAGMQAFIMNLRRDVFQDVRVRKAIALAFDFEWSNKKLFFGQYTRSKSFFSNSELAAVGPPSPEELALLEPFRDQLSPEVFGPPPQPPVTSGNGWPRDNLRKAFALLFEAGYEVKDLKLVHAETGEPPEFEMLLRAGGAFRRIVLPFQRNLKRLGIDLVIREVDDAQYVNRIRARDYDMVSLGWGQSDSPGNEQRSFWGSEAADLPSSRNFAGLKDPVVDALIEQLIAAPTRQDLVTRTRALDRVLLSHHFIVPNWHLSADRILYWNKFSRPAVVPAHGTSFNTWWWDDEKAAALRQARGKATN
jgi:microcin C transport system substrate-binding protein